MKVAFTVLVLCLAASLANAGVIFDDNQTASAGNAAAAGTTWTPGPGGAVGGIGGPIGFTMPATGLFRITVNDCCVVGDVFEVILDGVSLGMTSSEPIGGSTLSTGAWTLSLLAGSHTYDITDITLQYLGYASPFGGGTVDPGFSPAGLEVIGETVPEPAAWSTMIGAGLLLLGFRRRR